MRILNKQFSTMIELLGTDFILKRTSRNRTYETKYGVLSSKYTKKLKTIDDLCELCDLMNIAKKELLRKPNFLTQVSNNQDLVVKMNDPNYAVKTLDQIYAQNRPLLVTKSTTSQNVPKPKLQTIGTGVMKSLFTSKQDYEQTIKEQDWLPVQQLLIVDQTGQEDSAVAKASIEFKDATDPKNSYTHRDIRYFHLNPTYIVKFKNDVTIQTDIVVFISDKLKQLGKMSIWRDPHRHSTDPIDIVQLN